MRVYDPAARQVIHEFFVTGVPQAFTGGARVAMQPRRHYSPGGGTRTLLLASAISVSHPGTLQSSDGTPPLTPPAGLLDTPRCAIAAWTPWQERPDNRTVLHLLELGPDPQTFTRTLYRFGITGLSPSTRWYLESSPDLQTWSPRPEFFYLPPSASGTSYFEISIFGGLGPRHSFRLRQQ